MAVSKWIGASEFAALAGIDRRSATRVLSKGLIGRPWQGIRLLVRAVAGARGGRSGTRYEVALSSLPSSFQEALSDFSEASNGTCEIVSYVSFEPRALAANQERRMRERLAVIGPAYSFPARSAERTAELARASLQSGHSVRTLQRWLAELDAQQGDIGALGRLRHQDAGQPRVFVSRRFDAAFREAGHPSELLAEIGERVDQLLKAAWASPAQRAGWFWVGREALTVVQRECEARGVRLPKKALHLSKRRIMQHAEEFRRVDIYRHDRKRFDDQKPRIRRDWSKTAPMATIVMDVKPLDNVILRPDGSQVHPRMIGFMDAGTHRVFRHFVACPKGEGIRQEHVLEGFAAMVAHPEWGFPQQLYRDNGSEFFAFDKIRSALAMVQEPGARTIINAKPYSGASKPIESKFAVLDRFVFSQMGGWTGGNRMNAKTQTVGKPTAPFRGSFEEFVAEANLRIQDFETVEIRSGSLRGRSPDEIYADYVGEGWRPVSCHPAALDAAFSERLTRRVDRGAVSINGTRYRHPQLPNGRRVTIAIPYRRNEWPLVELLDGLSWAYLEPEMLFLPGEISGAIDSGRLQQREASAVRQIARTVGTIDAGENLADRVVALPTRAAPAPIIDLLMSSQAETLAAARAGAAERAEAAPDEAERRRARRELELQDWERYHARKRG